MSNRNLVTLRSGDSKCRFEFPASTRDQYVKTWVSGAYMMSTEEEKKNPWRPIAEEKKHPQSFWPPNPPKTRYGRHWGVVRRAMIRSFRVSTWKFYDLLGYIWGLRIYDEYIRKQKPSKADYTKKKKREVFDHQIHQTLATCRPPKLRTSGVSFDAQWY